MWHSGHTGLMSSQLSYSWTRHQVTLTEEKLFKEKQQDAGREMQPSEGNRKRKQLTSVCLALLPPPALQLFMVCAFSSAAPRRQQGTVPTLPSVEPGCLQTQRRAPKACSIITVKPAWQRGISATSQGSQQENAHCNLMVIVLHSPVALLLWVVSLLSAAEF